MLKLKPLILIIAVSFFSALLRSQNISFSPIFIDNAANFAKKIQPVDINSDGNLDILGASFSSDKISWYENMGNNQYQEHIISDSINMVYSTFGIDLDNDNDIDVLGISGNEQKVYWYENNGSNIFTEHSFYANISGGRDISAEDLDNDGDIDIVTASAIDDKITWYENNNMSFQQNDINTSFLGAYCVKIIDLDQDGHKDILAGALASNKISLFKNSGSNLFSEVVLASNYSYPYSIDIADVDGDSDLDFLTVSSGDGKLSLFEQISSLNFAEIIIDSTLSAPKSALITDLNGDGLVDYCAASSGDDRLYAYLTTTGSMAYNKITICISCDNSNSIVASDFDSNGYPDIVSANYSGNDIRLFLTDVVTFNQDNIAANTALKKLNNLYWISFHDYSITSLEVFNLKGQLVWQDNNYTSNKIFELNTSGLYIYKLNFPDGSTRTLKSFNY